MSDASSGQVADFADLPFVLAVQRCIRPGRSDV
jgi:hypothetical protein